MNIKTNDKSSPTPSQSCPPANHDATEALGAAHWLGDNDRQENSSILNLLSFWASESDRASLLSSSALSSRPASNGPRKKFDTWLKRLRERLLSVLGFGKTCLQTKSPTP